MKVATVLALMETLRPGMVNSEARPVAEAIVSSCRKEGAWAGKDCAPVLVAIFWHESRFVSAPTHRNKARGVGQTLPNVLVRWRGKTRRVPTGPELEKPEIGVRWALRVLESKWARCDPVPLRLRCALRRYGGVKRSGKYEDEIYSKFVGLRRRR